jgi:hypothetical protein
MKTGHLSCGRKVVAKAVNALSAASLWLSAIALLALTGCDRPPASKIKAWQATMAQPVATRAPLADQIEDLKTPASRSSEPPLTAESRRSARTAVRTYYALLAAGVYGEARRMWENDGNASGTAEAEFARSFADYESYHADIGAPRSVRDAAGFLYVQTPVMIHGWRKTGEPVRLSGVLVMRRSNDLLGSGHQSGEWHILSAPNPGFTLSRS